MNNNINKENSIPVNQSLLQNFKKFKELTIKKQKNLNIKELIQYYFDKKYQEYFKINRIWICVKIFYDKPKNKEIKDSPEEIFELFQIPLEICQKIKKYLKNYDSYIETATETHDEFLLDLSDHILNNNNNEENSDYYILCKTIKEDLEKIDYIKIFIGKSNNIILASFACLQCHLNYSRNKEKEKTNDLNYFLEIENDKNKIKNFLKNFSMDNFFYSSNIYFEDILKKINDSEKFKNIKSLSDITSEQIQTNCENFFDYKDIFLFSLGIGEYFHKKQIINKNNDKKNILNNYSFEENIKNKNQQNITNILRKLLAFLFKSVYQYKYQAKTLNIVLISIRNKIYKRVINQETYFDSYENMEKIAIQVMNNLFFSLSNNEIKNFYKLKVYFDNIISFVHIKTDIWQSMYKNQIDFLRSKTSKEWYWTYFFNENSDKKQSKSSDNFSIQNCSKKLNLNGLNGNVTSKSIDGSKKGKVTLHLACPLGRSKRYSKAKKAFIDNNYGSKLENFWPVPKQKTKENKE